MCAVGSPIKTAVKANDRSAKVVRAKRNKIQNRFRVRQTTRAWVCCGVPLLVGLATSFVFSPTLHNEFVEWDDDKNFLTNLSYRGLGSSQLEWMFTTFHMGLYIPLTWMTFGLDYLIWGMNPVGYHLTGLLLHAANAVIFYFVAIRVIRVAMHINPDVEGLKLWLAGAVAALLLEDVGVRPAHLDCLHDGRSGESRTLLAWGPAAPSGVSGPATVRPGDTTHDAGRSFPSIDVERNTSRFVSIA